MRLLNHPKTGHIFDKVFHLDRRGGTGPLALLAVFLQARLAQSSLEFTYGRHWLNSNPKRKQQAH